MTRRGKIIGMIALAMGVLIVFKAITVFLAELPLHQYKAKQSIIRELQEPLTWHQIAHQVRSLKQSLFWCGTSSDAHYEMGRTLHRLALDNEEADRLKICEGSGIDGARCDESSLLLVAMDHYDRAVQLNRLQGGARFWRLAAQLAYDERNVARQEADNVDVAPLAIGELTQAMAFEGKNPNLYRVAGTLANRLGNTEMAEDYYSKSLNLSLEGLEDILNNVLTWEDGHDRIDNIVPQTEQAQDRLAQALVEHWQFEMAKVHWERALSMRGETPPLTDPENLVTNGNFSHDLGTCFVDWQVQRLPGVSFKQQYEKGEGLMFELFHSPRIYYHATQKIPVVPGTPYRFSALIKPEGRKLKPASRFGFEVVHPIDQNIWSAGHDCVIWKKRGRNICEGSPENENGYFEMAFDFTPPQPLRMVILRFKWSGNPDIGTVKISNIRIEKIEPEEKETPDAQGP